jgi:hypothetical protein
MSVKVSNLEIRKKVINLVRKFSEGNEDAFKDFQRQLDILLGVDFELPMPPAFRDASVHAQEWALRVLSETKTAIKTFGRYSFDDKGPHEVMSIGVLADELRVLPPEEAGAYLEALAVLGPDYKTVADALLSTMDDASTPWWEVCCMACPSVEY